MYVAVEVNPRRSSSGAVLVSDEMGSLTGLGIVS